MIGLTYEHVLGLRRLIVPVADDEWMMGHRGSEWLALAPDLEEDLALSSISQDEIGHAKLFYDLAHDLGEPSADDQVYHRPANRWRHADLTTKPRQGWAEWVVRRYLYETFDTVRRSALERVPYAPLLSALKKMDREEAYHLTHARSLMQTLAHGGPTSQAKLQHALQDDWPLVPDLFEWVGPDESWAGLDIGELAPSAMRRQFLATLKQDFLDWSVAWPENLGSASKKARRHDGSETLIPLLDDMRTVRNIAPAGNW